MAGDRAKANADTVPDVDGADDVGEVNDFLVAEVRAEAFVGFVESVGFGDEREDFGPFEGGAFAVGVERGFAPGVKFVEALFGFAEGRLWSACRCRRRSR